VVGMVRRRTPKVNTSPPGASALVDSVYEQIVGLLIDQRIAPGSPLRTEALGTELGVSATPVREALARLETTGLVDRSAHRGWRVAPPLSRNDQVRIIELRLLLEPENARLACGRADDALRAQLAALAARQAAAPVGPDYAGYAGYLKADWGFHLLIASSTGNPYLEKAFTTVSGYLQRFQLFDQHVITDARECSAEHGAILDAFTRRSPEIAAAAMRDHLLRLRDRVVASTDS